MLPKIKIIEASEEFIAEMAYGLIKAAKSFEQGKRLVFGLNKELFYLVHNSNSFEDIGEKMLKYVRDNTNKELVKSKSEILQSMADDFSRRFFERIKNILGCEFYYEEFIGNATDISAGSYCDDNQFVVGIREDLDISSFVIAEEILHIIYWKYWKDIFGKEIEHPWLIERESKNGLSTWKISETIPEYFFDFKNGSGREKSYPWIGEVKKILDPLWEKKKDFREFLIEAHKLCGFKPI